MCYRLLEIIALFNKLFPVPANFDANACYGLLPEVRNAIACLPDLYNPSSIHQNGQKSRAILEVARTQLAELLNISKEQRVVFTSGASESNTQALFYPFWEKLNQESSANLIISAIEHPSVIESARKLEKHGIELRIWNPFSTAGVEGLDELLDENTRLISIMTANNETGLVLPVSDIFKKVKEFNPKIFTHTDAVQAAGKLEFKANEIQADFISLSAHKLGALTGVGALIVNRDFENLPLIFGGPQESRWRAGTENVVGIYSFGIAAEVWNKNAVNWRKGMNQVRNNLVDFVINNCPNIKPYTPENSLPNTISLEIAGKLADDLVVAFDVAGIAVSSGSACASGKPLPSHVLLAMGKSLEQARSTLRISYRADVSEKDLGLFKKQLQSI